uniref:Mannose-P-dolichol utilization defect 1 protein homolog n=1 Tax=Fibrocapsa japonica TaxID=94617 RepID=A0A7S2V5B2_9STRA|mmetsp:Transcript_7356/g.11073  ORF Transcript_7356/g.11073 Transcript_7356/m.11073 type:complete len:249 (+) Transcript_7356:72-818(+)|eukprot:CAMPEP_0113938552 /NCGR_PEP_ID=MMETSP1339-20121228/4981_1 /TAXON_ID=94617 /ORGANISM="Fibrocapsa japonica" /LENGTH=248 /DNA_ID=CAMNT_0000941723 /DNA_START=64 /DNA_END=810 /DNA_ORIENTATION=- /assembly_acc=CAM_ASM_000762
MVRITNEPLVMGVFTETCYQTMFVDGNLFEEQCLKRSFSKLLGYALSLGSLGLKLPQILKILKSKSVEGLSPSSFYSEEALYVLCLMYHFIIGSPWSAFGEVISIFVQNLVLVGLLWRYAKPTIGLTSRLLVLAVFAAIAAACWYCPPSLQPLIPLANVPVIVMARVPQILLNFKNGHTGQLAFITVCMNAFGSLSRVLTTIIEVGGDWGLVLSYSVGSSLNTFIFLQMLYYWKNTENFQKQMDKKTQ